MLHRLCENLWHCSPHEVRGLVHRAVMPFDTDAFRSSKHLRYGDTSHAQEHHLILREFLGSFASTPAVLQTVLTLCSYLTLPKEVTNYMEQFTPRIDPKTWDIIGAFVRDAVSLAAPQTAYSAEILLTAAAHFVGWCRGKAMPLDAEVIWSRQAIDMYVNDKHSHLNEGTRRNYRARLMRISEVLLPEEHGEQMTALNRKTTAAPYSGSQMKQHREWAVGQLTPFKRYRAMLMLVLTAGAGLRPSEIALVQLENIEALPTGGFAVHVRGEQARMVPLLAIWDEWMEALFEQGQGDRESLWGTPDRARPSTLLSAFTQNTNGVAPRGDRLRSTWLVTILAAGVPAKEVFRAGGFAKFEHLPRLLAYVPDASSEHYTSSLRGSLA